MKMTFFVPGIPAPGGSKRFVGHSKKTGRAILIDAAGERNKNWRSIVQCPAPCVEKAGWVDRSKAPSPLRSMGKLIAAGLARLNPDAKQYEATDDGRQWLAKLAKHNLLPS